MGNCQKETTKILLNSKRDVEKDLPGLISKLIDSTFERGFIILSFIFIFMVQIILSFKFAFENKNILPRITLCYFERVVLLLK